VRTKNNKKQPYLTSVATEGDDEGLPESSCFQVSDIYCYEKTMRKAYPFLITFVLRTQVSLFLFVVSVRIDIQKNKKHR